MLSRQVNLLLWITLTQLLFVYSGKNVQYTSSRIEPFSKQFNEALQVHGAVVISVCNKPKLHFCSFLKSGLAYGAMLHVINFGGAHGQNTDKLIAMENELEKFSNNTVVMFADCFDVVFNNHFGKMVQQFRNSGNKIMFAVEYKCFPDDVILKINKTKKVETGDCKLAYTLTKLNRPCFKNGPIYINSGTYIGYVGALREFLRDAVNDLKIQGGSSDQRYFHEALLKGAHEIYLDHCVQYFMCMYGQELICGGECTIVQKVGSYLKFKPTNMRPFIVHFEANTKHLLFTKYINDTQYSVTNNKKKAPMLWVNYAPSDLTDYCPN